MNGTGSIQDRKKLFETQQTNPVGPVTPKKHVTPAPVGQRFGNPPPQAPQPRPLAPVPMNSNNAGSTTQVSQQRFQSPAPTPTPVPSKKHNSSKPSKLKAIKEASTPFFRGAASVVNGIGDGVSSVLKPQPTVITIYQTPQPQPTPKYSSPPAKVAPKPAPQPQKSTHYQYSNSNQPTTPKSPALAPPNPMYTPSLVQSTTPKLTPSFAVPKPAYTPSPVQPTTPLSSFVSSGIKKPPYQPPSSTPIRVAPAPTPVQQVQRAKPLDAFSLVMACYDGSGRRDFLQEAELVLEYCADLARSFIEPIAGSEYDKAGWRLFQADVVEYSNTIRNCINNKNLSGLETVYSLLGSSIESDMPQETLATFALHFKFYELAYLNSGQEYFFTFLQNSQRRFIPHALMSNIQKQLPNLIQDISNYNINFIKTTPINHLENPKDVERRLNTYYDNPAGPLGEFGSLTRGKMYELPPDLWDRKKITPRKIELALPHLPYAVLLKDGKYEKYYPGIVQSSVQTPSSTPAPRGTSTQSVPPGKPKNKGFLESFLGL